MSRLQTDDISSAGSCIPRPCASNRARLDLTLLWRSATYATVGEVLFLPRYLKRFLKRHRRCDMGHAEAAEWSRDF